MLISILNLSRVNRGYKIYGLIDVAQIYNRDPTLNEKYVLFLDNSENICCKVQVQVLILWYQRWYDIYYIFWDPTASST